MRFFTAQPPVLIAQPDAEDQEIDKLIGEEVEDPYGDA